MTKPANTTASDSEPATPQWLAPVILGLGVVSAFILAWPRPAPAVAAERAAQPFAAAPSQPSDDYGEVLGSGTAAPDFRVERLAGGTMQLSALRGRVVMIDFWATWCPPCRAEMPWLVPLAKKYEAQGLTFLAVSQDAPEEQRAEVARFVREVPGLERYAVLGTPELGRTYGAESLPTLYLIDRSGRVLASKVGLSQEGEVTRAVERALSMAP